MSKVVEGHVGWRTESLIRAAVRLRSSSPVGAQRARALRPHARHAPRGLCLEGLCIFVGARRLGIARTAWGAPRRRRHLPQHAGNMLSTLLGRPWVDGRHAPEGSPGVG